MKCRSSPARVVLLAAVVMVLVSAAERSDAHDRAAAPTFAPVSSSAAVAVPGVPVLPVPPGPRSCAPRQRDRPPRRQSLNSLDHARYRPRR